MLKTASYQENLPEMAGQRHEPQLLSTLIQKSKLSLMKQLTAGLAHELKNPLAVIRLEADLMAEQISQLPERERLKLTQYLKVIEHNITQMSEIVDQVRRLSQKSDEDYGKINLHEILEGLRKQIIRLINNDKIKLIFELKAFDPHFYGNKTNIEQVFFNLITNASHAIQSSGTGSRITIRTSSKDDGFLVEVEDDGPGIEPTVLPSIFDPFFTTKEVDQGIGLGLSIVARILSSHGGTIEVASERGSGARFHFWLPNDRRAHSSRKKANKV